MMSVGRVSSSSTMVLLFLVVVAVLLLLLAPIGVDLDVNSCSLMSDLTVSLRLKGVECAGDGLALDSAVLKKGKIRNAVNNARK